MTQADGDNNFVRPRREGTTDLFVANKRQCFKRVLLHCCKVYTISSVYKRQKCDSERLRG